MGKSKDGSRPVVGLRIEPDLLRQVDNIAKKTRRTRTDVIMEAVINYWDLGHHEGIKADLYSLEQRLTEIEKKLHPV